MAKPDVLLQKMYTNVQNGRITGLTDNETVKSYKLFDHNTNENNKFKDMALQGIQMKSALSQLFFSKMNMNRIQDKLRYAIYIQSNNQYVIEKQSEIELEIIMRSIYLQHSKNLECNYKEQIEELNMLVLQWIIPHILSEIEQYMGYIKTVQQLPIPLPLPKNISSAGTRSLRSVTSTF